MTNKEILDVKVLFVEDDPAEREITSLLLKRRVREIITAENGREGLEKFRDAAPDVVITDIRMPEMDGLDMSREIRALNRDVKIIVTTAHSDSGYLMKAIKSGIDHYVVKPVMVEELMEALEKCASLILYRKRIEKYQEEREKLIGDLKTALDERDMLIKKLEYVSITDALTGLSNRKHFNDYMNAEWKRAMRNGAPISLVMVDIDFFKKYNDFYGHVAGDTCLSAVAGELKKNLRRPGDFVARYGGEEFAIVLPETDSMAAVIAEKCIESVRALELPHEGSSVSPWVTISAGVCTMVPHMGFTYTRLIEGADQALYRAKQEGRNMFKKQPNDKYS